MSKKIPYNLNSDFSNNYIKVFANDNDINNGINLLNIYNESKLKNPSSSNIINILLDGGIFKFNDSFELDTPYINLINISKNKAKFLFTNSNHRIYINTNNIKLSNIESNTFLFNDNMYDNILINCKSNNNSFNAIENGTINSTFIDCISGNNSFGYNNIANGIFINCIAGNNSFGSGNGNFELNGMLLNCKAGIFSYGGNLNKIKNNAKLINCTSNSNFNNNNIGENVIIFNSIFNDVIVNYPKRSSEIDISILDSKKDKFEYLSELINLSNITDIYNKLHNIYEYIDNLENLYYVKNNNTYYLDLNKPILSNIININNIIDNENLIFNDYIDINLIINKKIENNTSIIYNGIYTDLDIYETINDMGLYFIKINKFKITDSESSNNIIYDVKIDTFNKF